ncbi:desert hedgehog [Mytilus galloprovincialis]|uniref:Desert hedgehog n=1 Tax=Mytilus galloprovincialis TaxID=29158 RepID=A0A8B6EHH7_MYTGA|nr:desert hedgehog [Mytilus galloprovincialis]
MIVQNINDNRIEGESSSFVKLLKGLRKVGAVDPYNPNVVVVLTHGASIARKNWEEKVQKKKKDVKTIVQLYLGVHPGIVVQENLPDDHELESDGNCFEWRINLSTPRVDNRATIAKSNNAGYCFHEGSLVKLNNGNMKRIKDLRVGDKVLILYSKENLVEDEVIAWLHRLRTGQFTFLKIMHDFGEIILTPDHILFVGEDRNPQHASTVRPGDKLSFLKKASHDSKTVSVATVLSIQTVNGTGVYAPLTYNGRLLVDNVDVSCYRTLNPPQIMGRDLMSSHDLAHVAFPPMRISFKCGLDINKYEYDDETGIHGYARW